MSVCPQMLICLFSNHCRVFHLVYYILTFLSIEIEVFCLPNQPHCYNVFYFSSFILKLAELPSKIIDAFWRQTVYIKDEARNGGIDLEYIPIDYSFRNISVLTTWNLHDNLPKSIRRSSSFQSVLQQRGFFHSLTCFPFALSLLFCEIRYATVKREERRIGLGIESLICWEWVYI